MNVNPNYYGVRYIVIYESELRVLAGLAASGGDLEFAGLVFVLWTRDGVPVIHLVTTDGSGPAADGPPGTIHRPGYCEISPGYFHTITSLIEHTYGVKLGGVHHCHHFLGLNGPSGPDTRQVVSILRRNDLRQFISIITTVFDGSSDRSSRSDGIRRRGGNRRRDGGFRVNAFLYDDPQGGHYERVGLHVLPGISPLRLSVLAGSPVNLVDIGEHAREAVPMARIRYDAADPNETLPGRPTPGLDSLSEQIRRIPEVARDRIGICTGEGTVMLDVPLPAGATGRIIVDEEPPHLVRWAGLKGDPNGDSDVVDMIPVGEGDLLLERAYAMLASQAHLNGTNGTPPGRGAPSHVRFAFDVRCWLDAARATGGGVCRAARRLVQGLLRSRRTGAELGRYDDVDLGDRHEWEANDD